METVAKYFRETQQGQSIYAVVRVGCAAGKLDGNMGQVRTWSTSKAAARRARDKEWNPERWRIIKMTLQPDQSRSSSGSPSSTSPK